MWLPDDLWEAIEPLLPKEPPKPKGGRPRIPDRAALGGIIFVLRTGTPWRQLPQELGCGSGSTCWRRLRDWEAAGVWVRLHATVLNWLGDAGAIDWSRASVDSISVRAKRGGDETGPNPVDRGKRGSKYHLAVDCNGIPLAVRLSAANVHDSKLLEPLLDAIPPIIGPRGRPGRPRFRPAKQHADKAYDSPEKRRALRRRGITPRIARRGVDSSERLGRYRWIVERSLAWLLGFRRLGIRYERRSDLLLGLLHLACALVCIRSLPD
ncbi:MAG: IS5 family transposase [Chloroflexota bacterium]